MLFLSLYEVLYQKQLTSCWTAKFFLTCWQISSVDNNSWLWKIRLHIKKNNHKVTLCNFDMWQPHFQQSGGEKTHKTHKQSTSMFLIQHVLFSSSTLLYHFRINNQSRLTDSSWSAFKWVQEDLLHVVE